MDLLGSHLDYLKKKKKKKWDYSFYFDTSYFVLPARQGG